MKKKEFVKTGNLSFFNLNKDGIFELKIGDMDNMAK